MGCQRRTGIGLEFLQGNLGALYMRYGIVAFGDDLEEVSARQPGKFIATVCVLRALFVAPDTASVPSGTWLAREK